MNCDVNRDVLKHNSPGTVEPRINDRPKIIVKYNFIVKSKFLCSNGNQLLFRSKLTENISLNRRSTVQYSTMNNGKE